jgi:hypothetical protein
MFKSQEHGRHESRPPAFGKHNLSTKPNAGAYFHRIGVPDLEETKEYHDDLMSVLGSGSSSGRAEKGH